MPSPPTKDSRVKSYLDNQRLALAMQAGSLRVLESAAITATVQATLEARGTLQEAGYPVQEYFRNNTKQILEQDGLLDHWLTTVALLAMELALAPPDGPITAVHVEE